MIGGLIDPQTVGFDTCREDRYERASPLPPLTQRLPSLTRRLPSLPSLVRVPSLPPLRLPPPLGRIRLAFPALAYFSTTSHPSAANTARHPHACAGASFVDRSLATLSAVLKIFRVVVAEVRTSGSNSVIVKYTNSWPTTLASAYAKIARATPACLAQNATPVQF